MTGVAGHRDRMRAAAWLVLASCATQHHVVVTGNELHHALPALRDTGVATVEVTDKQDNGRETHMPTSLQFDDTIVLDHKRVTIRDATAVCPREPPFVEDAVSGKNCPLVQHRYDDLPVRDYTTHAVGRTVLKTFGALVLGATIAAVGCEAGCRDGTLKDASSVELVTAGVLLIGGIVAAIVSCSGHWGDSGCRD
jgi:hypothetical protein